MGWAARRKTSREEDVVYCLLGIFSIDMPLLYGESPEAFIRLQSEILTRNGDESILAWNTFLRVSEGIFAEKPLDFANASNVREVAATYGRPQSLLTGHGVEMRIQVPDNGGAYRHARLSMVSLETMKTKTTLENRKTRSRLTVKKPYTFTLLNMI